jgi:hypothetical protein
MTITTATFIGAAPHMEIAPGHVTDAAGSLTVATSAGAGSPSNPGASILLALKAGMIPLPPQTAGYATAHTAALTAITAVTDTPTGAEVIAALTAVLAAANALTAE